MGDFLRRWVGGDPLSCLASPKRRVCRLAQGVSVGVDLESHTEILFVNGGSCLALEISLSGAGRSLSCIYGASDCAYTSL